MSLSSNSPIHIGPSILNPHQSCDTINGGDYHIKVKMNDKEHMEKINANLDYLKDRNLSLKGFIQNEFIELSRSNGKGWFFRLAAIIITSVCTMTIMNGITIQLSK